MILLEVQNVQLYSFLSQMITVLVSAGTIGAIAFFLLNRYFKNVDGRKAEEKQRDAERVGQIELLYTKINSIITKVDILISQLTDHKQYDEEYRAAFEGRITTACGKITELKRIEREHHKDLSDKVAKFDKAIYGLEARINTLENFIKK